MDLSYSDEHRQFADGLERFLSKSHSYEHRRALVTARTASDPAIWQQLAEFGCFGLAVPEAKGGFGGDTVSIGLMARALGRHLVVEPVLPAVLAGVLLAGTRGAEGHIEALASGERRFAVADRSARAVAGGMAADHLLIVADDALSIADASDPDRTPVPMLDDSLAADIDLTTARPEPLALADDWPQQRAAARTVDALFRGWQALGCLEGAVDATAAYMRDRVQFGRPLGSLQVVQHRVAEMVVAAKEAEMVALLAALTVEAVGPGAASGRAVITMTARIAAAAGLVADSAVQLHGGMGVSDELDIAARFRHLQAYRLRAAAHDDPASAYAETVVASRAHHRSAVLIEA
ncbi:acyl-CoA dehydrogenase family protein [Polymorphobacter sp.]|uniref:acyl-CoA dehydrogenase family protein n=1 Tax=Polymorphobacter sp. TaxID=1909290 RepID=UPI003F72B967